MQRLKDKRLGQKEAAEQLGLSVRQVKRLWQKYKKQAAKGLISQRRGKASNHRLEAEVVQQALDLLKKKYADFGPTLAHEKLQECDQVQISRESVRKLMMAEGLWKPRRRKKEVVHQMRERRACFGELIQIDGSEHIIYADTVIKAIGQHIAKGIIAEDKIDQTRWGTVKIQMPIYMTNRHKVFAGGDLVKGPSLVVDAVYMGRKASEAIVWSMWIKCLPGCRSCGGRSCRYS